jgi:hypothetical protein
MEPTWKGVPMQVTVEVRELAARDSDGIGIRLLWHPGEDVLTVSVGDTRAGEHYDLAVARDRALDAFYHPFAYVTPRTGSSPHPRRDPTTGHPRAQIGG